MANAADILTNNIEVWTGAIERRSAAGRGRSKKFSLYGIDKLRALILDLAVRGKLVPQDPSEEPASTLLERIAESRKNTQKLKKKDLRSTPKLRDRQIPTGWCIARLDDIANSQAGFAFKSNGFNEIGAGLPLIRIRDVGLQFSGTYYSGEYREEFVVKDGDYLICMDGDFRVAAWTNGPALLNQRVSRLQFYSNEIVKKYVVIDLQKQLSKLQGVKAYTTVDHLSGKQISEAEIALPPLAEQHRIIAKVDELMALCDRLEAQTYDAIEAHELLVGNLLATLTRSQNAEGLAENWARIETHFDTLFTTGASIDQLKQTILQLAVMGKLVPQDPNEDRSNQRRLRPDETAESYDAKAYAARAKKFPLPTGWAIEPLSRTSSHIVDCPHTTPKWTAEGYLCAKSEQIMPGYLDLRNPNYVSEDTFIERIERLKPEPEDILFKREGGILGVACRIPEGTELCLGQRLMLIRANESILPPFLELVLNAPWTTDYAREMTTGGAAPRVNMAIVRAFPIPLPPKREQQRILARLSELTDLCESLKVQLSIARAAEVSFADAVASKAVA